VNHINPEIERALRAERFESAIQEVARGMGPRLRNFYTFDNATRDLDKVERVQSLTDTSQLSEAKQSNDVTTIGMYAEAYTDDSLGALIRSIAGLLSTYEAKMEDGSDRLEQTIGQVPNYWTVALLYDLVDAPGSE
jgi:hypothetical protein